MKIGWQDLGQLNSNSQDDITRAVVVPAKEALRQLRQAVGGNLTIRDNQYAAIVTLGAGTQSLTSGTEYTLQNPLKTTPIGFTVIKATDANGNAVTWASEKLNTSRTDGLLGITVTQDLLGGSGDVGEYVVSSVLQPSSVTINNSVAHDVTSIALGSGDWDVTGFEGFTGAPTGTVITAWINTSSLTDTGANGLGVNKNSTGTMPTANSDVLLPLPIVRIPGPATAYLSGNQIFTAGTLKAYGEIRARRAVRQLGQQMIVTGILWGG